MRAFTLSSIFAVSLAAGCYGTVGYDSGGYAVSNVAYGPDLVYAAPGVQVIADWNEPIFFLDGFYWRYYDGGWYSSASYTGGWAYAAPPPALLRIDQPHRFAHYRPQGWTPRRYDNRGPVVRDHRNERPRYEPRRTESPRTPPPPPHRDGDRGRHDDHGRDHRR